MAIKYPWLKHKCQDTAGRRRHSASQELEVLINSGRTGKAVLRIVLSLHPGSVSTMLRIHFCPFCGADLDEEVRRVEPHLKE